MKHLEMLISSTDENLLLLGGWAVHMLVNERFKKDNGRVYLGSRDIDLGFSLSKGPERASFMRVYRHLTERMGFRPLSFRLFKEIHLETGEMLDGEKAKSIPLFNIFQMYVDMIVDTVPKWFKDRYHFIPINEPMVKSIFEDKENHIVTQAFGKQIWLPATKILVGMKIKSFPDREKEHKRSKDLADLVTLVLYSKDANLDGLEEIVGLKSIRRFRKTFQHEDAVQASILTGLDTSVIEGAISRISENK